MPSWAPAHSDTSFKLIILGRVSSATRVSGQSWRCTPSRLLSSINSSTQPQHSEVLYPLHTVPAVEVMKRCRRTWASSCVSPHTASSLRAACRRRHPKMHGSPHRATRSPWAQRSEAEGLLSLCQVACWETSRDTGKTTRPTFVLWHTRISAAPTPGPSQTGNTLRVKVFKVFLREWGVKQC